MTESSNRIDEALEALAAVWNRLDPDVLRPYLTDNVRYECFETELAVEGREAVMEHLHRKMELIEMVGEAARIHAEVGWVHGPRGSRRPCVVAGQGDKERTTLYLITLDPTGMVERIVLSIEDPDPRSAVVGDASPH